MPEENLITDAPIAKKKPRKKTVAKRKKAEKSPFKFNNKLNAVAPMPKADFKPVENLAFGKKMETSLPARPAKSIYRKLAVSFVALTLILVAVVLYFGFSKVSIIIIPAREKISDSLTAEIANQAENSPVDSRQILGVVKQVPVEQSKIFNSSGKEILGEEVTGKVTIVNNYIKNQPLVASTRLLSADNKLFRLKNTVNVPAGGQVEAEVYADEAKREMAIGPSKFILPGLWAGIQDKIYAQSQEPMKYSEKIKYTIQQSDIDNAVKELRSNLLAGAKNQVSQAYANYGQMIYRADNNSVSQEVSGKVGEEKQNFTIKMKTMVTVVAFNDNDIYEQAKAKLAASLADDKQILEFGKSDISYNLENYDLSQGRATVKADFNAKVILKDNATVIKKNNLAGMNYEQLKNYLSSLPEVAGYEIKFFPSFIKKVPDLVDRINIEIKK